MADRTPGVAERIDRLERAAARIEQTGRDDLAALEFDLTGARSDFSAGAERFHLHGVTGTSTCSRADAMRSWARAARRRAARLREA